MEGTETGMAGGKGDESDREAMVVERMILG